MKVHDTNHVADFRDLCPRLSPREVSVKVGVMEFGLYCVHQWKQRCFTLQVLLGHQFTQDTISSVAFIDPRLHRFNTAAGRDGQTNKQTDASMTAKIGLLHNKLH